MAAETETIKDFLVKLGFDIDERSLGNFVEGINSATIRAMAFGTAITAAAAEVVHSVHEIAQENVQLSLLAKELNTTANAIDGFIDTADMLGISNETATNSLKNFSRNVQDAAMGIGRAKMVFEKLNIAVKDASGHARAATDVMADLQSKMEGMDRAKQLRIMERLGLDPKMLIMFNDAFGKTQYIGEELGKIDVASGFNLDKSIEQSKQFNQTWKEMTIEFNLLRMLFSKMYEAIAVQLMPSIQAGIKKVTQALTDARHEIMDNAQKIESVLKPIIEVVLKIGSAFLQIVSSGFKLFIETASKVIQNAIDINNRLHGIPAIILAIAAAWKVFNLAFLTSPVGRILVLGLALLALYDDYRVFTEGGKSLIDWNSKMGTTIKYVAEAIAVASTALMAYKGLMMAFTAVQKIASIATLAFNILFRATPFGLFLTGITLLIAGGYALIHNWDKVKVWFHGFFDFFTKGWDKIAGIFDKIKSGLGGSLGKLEQKLTPSFAGGGRVTANHQTTIHVNGAGNPQAVAQAVANQQHSVSQQTARNLRGSVR